MSAEKSQQSAALQGVEPLKEYFRGGIKAPEARVVGLEHEKFGYRPAEHGIAPLTYEEVRQVLEKLSGEYGWERAYEEGRLIALNRGGMAITLEPGGQLELAGSALNHLDDVGDELVTHLAELLDVSDSLGFRWLAMGVRPLDVLDDVPWMPKGRYDIMRAYLPTRGEHAHNMMKMTSTVQANFDFTSEEDAAQMLRTALRTTPLVSALFANSPFAGGQLTGSATTRCHYWTDTDPDRTGYLRFMFEPGFTFGDYVEYLLDMPMFFVERDHHYIPAKGRSFRSFLEEGFEGHTPTLDDWEMHMSTAFPEVRLKRYIEVRGADVGSPANMMALAALWKGILYDNDARTAALSLTEGLGYEQTLALHQRMITDGLAAELEDGTPLSVLAAELVEIASRGLAAQQGVLNHGRSEEPYLDVLREEVLDFGLSHAETMIHAVSVSTESPVEAIAQAITPRWITGEQIMQIPSPLVLAEHGGEPGEEEGLDLLYLDDHFVAVNKPAGVAVHASRDHEVDNLMTLLAEQLDAIGVPWEEPLAPSNRLDLGASGIVLVGLNDAARSALGKAFAGHEMRKVYWILTTGRLRKKGVINRPLRRGKEEEPKPSRTQYKTLAISKRASYAKAWTEQGRTHQVRRHMSSIGNPILGDTRYGFRKSADAFRKRYSADRIMLHARQISGPHPVTGDRLHIVASPGREWDRVVEALGLEK